MLEKINRYIQERKKWTEAGSPKRTDEKIKELFNICSANTCGEYIKINDIHGQCNLCGCHLKNKYSYLNKLSYATTRCPYNPPFWIEEPEFENIDIKKNEIKQQIEENPIEPIPTPPPKKRNCGCG